MATHTGDKIGYTCESCNKQLTTRKSLRDHQRIHTGERPFPCAVCAAAFRTETLLRAHRRQHASQLQCSACGQACRTEAQMAAHERTYHPALGGGRPQLVIAETVTLAPALLVTVGTAPPGPGEAIF
ncbi:zinc finger protein 670-like [Pollicipes pollicipes]|uniref:zinc finger protein 670-like n=1 Tax=Pollicipes pollicipes TaxID=41117 RepID=UPI001884F083|nr:zinc finger protein 670-like [Pollicipes pollicipes]